MTIDQHTKMPLLFFERDVSTFVTLGVGTLDHILKHELLSDYIGKVLPFHFDELPDERLVAGRIGWISPCTVESWSQERSIYEFEFLKTEKRAGRLVITKRVR